MEKILTISIAAYNVENFIKKTLDSCIVESLLEDYEVIIVNDGSKDCTLEIAKEYEMKYPGTFVAIDKENGGYGSTVNTSMKLAKGKYFKLLDGDDWFDTNGLERLIKHLKKCDSDLVLNPRKEVSDTYSTISGSIWIDKYLDKYNGQTVNINDLDPFVYGIWVATIKTSILHNHKFELPRNQLYTDRVFTALPLFWIKTISFLDYVVYNYRVGHEEQSVNVNNRIKHYKESISGYEYILNYYSNHIKEIGKKNKDFVDLRIGRDYLNVIRTLMLLPASYAVQKTIKKLDYNLKAVSKDIFELCGNRSRSLKLFRMTNYYFYWLRKLKKVDNWY